MALGQVPTRDVLQEAVPSSQRTEPGSINLPISPWPKYSKQAQVDPVAIARSVFDSFNHALANEATSASDLFLEDALWRDHLALFWNLHTFKGDRIRSSLETQSRLKQLHVDESSAWRKPKIVSFSPVEDVPGIQVYLNIEMEDGTGRGMARLAEKNGQWKIWTLYTSREIIKGHEELLGPKRPKGVEHGGMPGRKNWLDRRVDEINLVGYEPDVLIIGMLHLLAHVPKLLCQLI
jgi:hypothetical protein